MSQSVEKKILLTDIALPESLYKSNFESFLELQISKVIEENIEKTPDIDKIKQLSIAIEFCKQFLANYFNDSNNFNNEKSLCSLSDKETEKRRKEVLEKLVELKLQLEELKLLDQQEELKIVQNHQLYFQSGAGRNPYCEICLSTIWRLVQKWRRCNICGIRVHEKCINSIKRSCVSLYLKHLLPHQPPLIYQICLETTLPEQNYQCAECHATISFNEKVENEARLCDYSGKYFCRSCHWDDQMVIPARLVCNWDSEKRFVSRSSKQLLTVLEKKPLINLHEINPKLFDYVIELQKMRILRKSILIMKNYFINCKNARKLKILQYLNRHQHFVETDSLYSIKDLILLSEGKLLSEIEQILQIFKDHITKECIVCEGNGFYCELCDEQKVIYPFNTNVSICSQCNYVFHKNCFKRVNAECPRCNRRIQRKSLISNTFEN